MVAPAEEFLTLEEVIDLHDDPVGDPIGAIELVVQEACSRAAEAITRGVEAAQTGKPIEAYQREALLLQNQLARYQAELDAVKAGDPDTQATRERIVHLLGEVRSAASKCRLSTKGAQLEAERQLAEVVRLVGLL